MSRSIYVAEARAHSIADLTPGGAPPMPDDRYDISKDVLFGQGERIDLAAVAAAQTPWWNRTLTEVNDAVVRLAVMEGDFHWHKHDDEDEFFYVLDGALTIELEDGEVHLQPGQGVT